MEYIEANPCNKALLRRIIACVDIHIAAIMQKNYVVKGGLVISRQDVDRA
jgi:hypothetical protein